uniref:Microtubule-associated protein n=1 Tax=Panagrellus redivivus TaxID=6233 RepID=A0A7E4VPT4_PANRE
MSQASSIVIGVRDKAAEVALRRQLLAKERELKLQAKLREQDDKLKRVEEQKVAELQRKAKLRAQKELEKAKAVLDRKQAQLEADKNRKAEILQRAHQAASRTAQTSPAKVYAFGSSTPRELTYLERLARDQKTPPRVGTTTTTPKKSPVPSTMTTSCYVPRVAVSKPTESKPASVKPAVTRRSPTANPPKAKVDRMSASMYTPSTPASRRSLAASARVKREETPKKASTPQPSKPVPATRRVLPPRPPTSKAPVKEGTPAKNPVIAALSVPKKILPKKVVEQQAAEPEKIAEVSVEKAADALPTEETDVDVVEAVKQTENNNLEAVQKVPSVDEDALVQELHNLKLSDCSTPEPNDVVETHDSGIDDALSTKADASDEVLAVQKEEVPAAAEPVQEEAVNEQAAPIHQEEEAHEEATPVQAEQTHEEVEAAPIPKEVHQEVEAVPVSEAEYHHEAGDAPVPEEDAHEEVPQEVVAPEKPAVEEPEVTESATPAEAAPIVPEIHEELVESEPQSVAQLIDIAEHVPEPVENGVHDLETDRPSELIKDEAATDDLNADNGTVEAASESFDEHQEPQVTNASPSAPFVNLDFVESSAPFAQESPITPDSDAPVDPAVDQPLVDMEEPSKPAAEVPLFQELAEAVTPKASEPTASVEAAINSEAQTNGHRTASPDSSASSTKGSSDAENVPVSEPESRSDMKARLNALMSRVRDPNVSPPSTASPKAVDGRALARALLEQRRNGNGASPTSGTTSESEAVSHESDASSVTVLTNLTLSEEMAVAGEKAQQQRNKSVMDILPGQVYEDEHAAGKRTPPEDPAHVIV